MKGRIKVLILGIGGLGDLVRLFPLVASLREELPQVELFLLTSHPQAEEIFSLLSPTERPHRIIFWDLLRRPPLFEKVHLFGRLLLHRFALLFDTSRGTGWRGNARLVRLLRAEKKIGFWAPGLSPSHLHLALPFNTQRPIVFQNLALLNLAGFKGRLFFPFRKDLPFPEGIPRKGLVVLHAGAAERGRLWPEAHWLQLAAHLQGRFQVVAVGGQEEARLFANRPEVINLCGRLRLEELAGLLKEACLFVGVDSGPLHLALALKTPSVGIFGPTDPRQVVGEEGGLFRAVFSGRPCAPCYQHLPGQKVRCPEAPCLQEISPEEVLLKVESLLS